MLHRRELLLGALALGAGASLPALGQAYQQRPVRIIVPCLPGGATDIYARIIAKNLAEILGQPFIVENKPGADTMIGAQAATTAKPDGYTLLYTVAATVTANQFLYKDPLYKPEDLTPICLTGTSRFTLTIDANLPVKNIKEFVEYVRARPGKVVMATLGPASGGHLAGKTFEKVYGLDMIEVPYKGSAEANTALLSGTAALYPDGISGALQLHKAGKVRIIAVTSKTRSPELPDVPSTVELGFPEFQVGTWFALFAPAGTPPDIVNQLNAATAKVVAGEEFKSRLLSNGIIPESNTVVEMAALVKSTTELSRKMIADLKIPPQ